MKRNIFYFLSVSLLNISLAYPMMESTDDNEYVPKIRVKTLTEVEKNIFTGCPYKIKLKHNNQVLDGSRHMISLQLSHDGDNQAWTLTESPNYSRYFVKIMKVGDQRILDSGKDEFIDNFDFGTWGATTWNPHDKNHRHYNRQVWMLEESKKYPNYFTFTTECRATKGEVLAFSDQGLCFRKKNLESDQQLWQFVPVNYQLSATMENFNYDYSSIEQNIDSSTRESSYIAFKAINKGTTSDTHHISMDKTITRSSTWSIAESEERTFLNQFTLKANVQPIKISEASIGGEVSETITWGKKTTSLETTQKLEQKAIVYKLQSDITVPPQKKVDYRLVWKTIKVDIPFEADVKLVGSVDRLKKDGTIGPSELDADNILDLLPYAGYTGEVFHKVGNSISGKIKGKVHVIDAQDGQISKEESPIVSNYEDTEKNELQDGMISETEDIQSVIQDKANEFDLDQSPKKKEEENK